MLQQAKTFHIYKTAAVCVRIIMYVSFSLCCAQHFLAESLFLSNFYAQAASFATGVLVK